MAVELWNDKTANLIDDFENEQAALLAIREVIGRDGFDAIEAWALDRLDGKRMIAGKDLVELALSIRA